MTLHEVDRIFKHWQVMPPLRVLVAACAASLGVKLPDNPANKPKPMTAEEAKRFFAVTGGRIEGVGRM